MNEQQARYVLRGMTADDLQRVFEWRNQERIRNAMYTDHVISWEEHTQWFARVSSDPSNRQLVFQVDGRPVGVVSFADIDAVNQRARWGFYLGESDVAPGTGSRMEFLALEFAFETLGLRKLSCEVFSFNDKVTKMHGKFGFVEEGRFRQHILKDGVFEDIVVLGMLKAEWLSRRDKMRDILFTASEG
ncbi:MAG: UDP-4-amino-4,6-dideoxy-N-acetyl-beta-L-altrosamine N-acetyltransferase [Thermoleophilia bacterium]